MTHWTDDAACRGVYALADVTYVAAARRLIAAYCDACPVRQQCHDRGNTIGERDSVRHRRLHPPGIWGGVYYYRHGNGTAVAIDPTGAE